MADAVAVPVPVVPKPLAPETVRYHFRIASAFRLFDHENNNTVDVREIGTVIRSLGLAPTEAELHEIILEVEEEQSTGFIKYERFEPVIARILLEKKYRCSTSEDLLRRAFMVLDSDQKGYLTVEELTRAMTEQGEPFSADEFAEMSAACVEPEKKQVYYLDHAPLLVLDENAFG